MPVTEIPVKGKYHVGTTDIETDKLIIRLFYPSTPTQNNSTSWFPTQWIYSKGMGVYLKKMFLSPFLYLFYIREYLRLGLDAPLINIEEAKSFPFIFFSHGLTGMRSFYSLPCASFASHGFIVAAIEHKDRTACATFINNDPVYYKHPNAAERPPGSTPDEYLHKFRQDQLIIRKNEVYKALDLLHRLNQGYTDTISSSKYIKVNIPLLKTFESRFNFNDSIMVGHSFGAATTISVLQDNQYPFKLGLTYDPWMYSVDNKPTINVPFLSIQSETFHWKENIEDLKYLFTSLKNQSLFMMIKGTAHSDFSDHTYIFPRLMKSASGSVPGSITMPIWIKDSIDFISDHMPHLNLQKYKEKSELALQGDSAFDFIFSRIKKP